MDNETRFRRISAIEGQGSVNMDSLGLGFGMILHSSMIQRRRVITAIKSYCIMGGLKFNICDRKDLGLAMD